MMGDEIITILMFIDILGGGMFVLIIIYTSFMASYFLELIFRLGGQKTDFYTT